MSKPKLKSSSKVGGKHRTYTKTAAAAIDIATECINVTNIIAGIITMNPKKSGWRGHIKIIDVADGILLLTLDGPSNQEVWIHANDIQNTKLHIAKDARNAGLTISFGNRVATATRPYPYTLRTRVFSYCVTLTCISDLCTLRHRQHATGGLS